MLSLRFLSLHSQKHVRTSLACLIQRFCTISDADLQRLHDTDPARACAIYEHRIESITSHDTQSLFTLYSHLRDCYWRLNDDEQISKCTQKLYQLDPNHFYSNYVMAVETYNSALQLDFLLTAERFIDQHTPNHMIADVIYRISAGYSKQGNVENARKYIMKLNGVNDESFKIRQYVFLAHLDLHEGNTEAAIEYFRKAIELDAFDEPELEAKKHALQQVATYYNTKQEFDTAIKYYLQLYHEHNHKTSDIYQWICVNYNNYAAKFYNFQQYAQSIETYQQSLDFIRLHGMDYVEYEKDKESEWNNINNKYKYIAMKNIAQCYYIQNEMELTYQWMKEILTISPENWLANYFVGWYALAMEKDLDKALMYLMNAEENSKHDHENMLEVSDKLRAHAQHLMAIIYSKKGHFQRANVCMEIAFNLCSNMAGLYTGYAMIKATERNYYECCNHLKVADELKPWKNDNPKEIEGHLKTIQHTISENEFEYSETNKLALKCLFMIEHLRGNNIKCVEYAMQYRDIDMNDNHLNDIYASLTESI